MYRAITLAILFLPLLSFLLLLFGHRRYKEGMASLIGTFFTLCSLILSVYMVVKAALGASFLWESWSIPWFKLNQKVVSWEFELSPLNLLMLLVVGVVSFLVHVYSRGYMKGDSRFCIFYAYLSLFTFSMLGLVISANLLQLYIFWELVGVCSFLLIGFWYFKPAAKAAAKKAFIVTRVGDVGLFIAICLIFAKIDSFSIKALQSAMASGVIEPGMLTLIALLVLVGAMGKSGQFPLHIWLPDAMEGPTPVSALIHAATMVAAGVYLVATFQFLFLPTALATVAYVGGFTAIFAASIALFQHDIKRILAYSTISQLGYMMLALGCAGYVAGIFHLMTHAFFKSLLFLAAGAVIVSLHHVQDIRQMGGLWKRHRGLGIAFLIGCLSIAGVPPFSGFFSKEEIFLFAYLSQWPALLIIALLTSFLTAVYVFRVFFLVFISPKDSQGEIQPLSKQLMIPIYVLAALSMVAGFIQFPKHLLGDALFKGPVPYSLPPTPVWLPIVATLLTLGGIGLAYRLYVKNKGSERTCKLFGLRTLLEQKYYVDEIFQYTLVCSSKRLSRVLCFFDGTIIGGGIKGTTQFFLRVGHIGSRLQNGQVQVYVLMSLVGFLVFFLSLAVGRLFE